MKKGENNYAFIDAQNLHAGVKRLGWKLDFRRFRIYLAEKYGVTIAYLFIGYIPAYENLYQKLRDCGYVLIFKQTVLDDLGRAKGNIDADLVLQTMIDLPRFDQAVIVSSDGDFQSLVTHLYSCKKLRAVLSPDSAKCSKLLMRSAREKIHFMDNLRKMLEEK